MSTDESLRVADDISDPQIDQWHVIVLVKQTLQVALKREAIEMMLARTEIEESVH